MDRGDGLWQEAAAAVQASVDADLRDEAYEVFVAEAARCRLVDRAGPARVALRCGVTLDGELVPEADEAVAEHLVLVAGDGVRRLIPIVAIKSMTGSRPTLRPEEDHRARSLTSSLREAWSSDEPIRVLDSSGRWTAGWLDYVGADHVELRHGDGRTVVPMAAAEAWQVG